MDQWLEFSICTDGELAEAVSEVFSRFGTGGAVIEQAVPRPGQEGQADGSLTVKAFLPAGDTRARRALEEALGHLSFIHPLPEPRVRVLSREDWTEGWKHHFHIQHIGKRVVIVPSWLEYTPQKGEIIIHLDPGLAFGTGLHPTTRLCLRAMETLELGGASVLDVGTGSGILSIAAAKMGCARVEALDTDPLAVKVARRNIELNGVADRVRVSHGSISLGASGLTFRPAPGTDDPETALRAEGYDLTVANIIAEILIGLAEPLGSSLAPRGRIVVSGIIQDKEAPVRKALFAAGLDIENRLQEGDWIALLGTRRDEPARSRAQQRRA